MQLDCAERFDPLHVTWEVAFAHSLDIWNYL